MNSREEKFAKYLRALEGIFGNNQHYPRSIEGFEGPLPHVFSGKSYIDVNEFGAAGVGIKIPEDEVSFENLNAFVEKYKIPVSSQDMGIIEPSEEDFYLIMNEEYKTIDISRQGIKPAQIYETVEQIKDMVCDLSPEYFFKHSR